MSHLQSLAGKTLSIVGGSGYVGRNIAKKAADLGINVFSISRKGLTDKSLSHSLVQHVKGDALRPNDFKETLESSDATIFTIGALFDTTITSGAKPGDTGTYEHMNRDNAIAVANALNEIKGKRMVY